ncbi:MAG: TlpA disulfide reductase family protein [Candidatus Electryonea clarkiae]|nr:TlpA disulfide reductase family protein [Candidatus Electryonea clarkiae]MDP8288388.1 TlpA disulfide reductase family protein [Candidatus Electryonea clarkiae]
MRIIKVLIKLYFILIIILTLAGCKKNNENEIDKPKQSTEDSASETLTTLELIPVTSDELFTIITQTNSKAVILNIWATWCQPCREEFPDLLQVYDKYKDQGLNLLLVSADFQSNKAEAMEFLSSQGVTFQSYLKNENDQKFIDALHPSWSGALPATFTFDSEGKLINFHEGKTSKEKFEQMVREALSYN